VILPSDGLEMSLLSASSSCLLSRRGRLKGRGVLAPEFVEADDAPGSKFFRMRGGRKGLKCIIIKVGQC
jgi:hypothetical protein